MGLLCRVINRIMYVLLRRTIYALTSNGNIFRVTGPLCGEFTGHPWIPLTKASDTELWCYLWYVPWTNDCVYNREAGDLRRHCAHYDVILMTRVLFWCFLPELRNNSGNKHLFMHSRECINSSLLQYINYPIFFKLPVHYCFNRLHWSVSQNRITPVNIRRTFTNGSGVECFASRHFTSKHWEYSVCPQMIVFTQRLFVTLYYNKGPI